MPTATSIAVADHPRARLGRSSWARFVRGKRRRILEVPGAL
jgi:hypothetical protein